VISDEQPRTGAIAINAAASTYLTRLSRRHEVLDDPPWL
jgi:hypothetical protein